jgi:hypothetical protein
MSLHPWIGNAEAVSLSQFPGKIPHPVVGVDFQTVLVPISCQWLPYVAGACQALLAEAVWEEGSIGQLETTLKRVEDLLALFTFAAQDDGCETTGAPFACPYDFVLTDDIWGPFDHGPLQTPEFYSNWSVGNGFPNVFMTYTPVPGRVYGNAFCAAVFSPCTLTHVDFTYELNKGAFDVDDGNQTGIVIRSGGVNIAYQLVNSASQPDGANSVSWDGSLVADEIVLLVQCSNRIGTLGSGGSALITTAGVNGTGTPPC